jgi:hypothetical protein
MRIADRDTPDRAPSKSHFSTPHGRRSPRRAEQRNRSPPAYARKLAIAGSTRDGLDLQGVRFGAVILWRKKEQLKPPPQPRRHGRPDAPAAARHRASRGKSIVNQKQTPWGLIVTTALVVLFGAGIVAFAGTRHKTSSSTPFLNELPDAKVDQRCHLPARAQPQPRQWCPAMRRVIPGRRRKRSPGSYLTGARGYARESCAWGLPRGQASRRQCTTHCTDRPGGRCRDLRGPDLLGGDEGT